MLRHAERLQLTASSLSETAGVVRLGIAESIVHTWLSDFLGELQENYPLVDADIVVDSTTTLRSELMSHRIDLAVLMRPLLEYGIDNVELPSFPLAWVCAPDLKLPNAAR